MTTVYIIRDQWLQVDVPRCLLPRGVKMAQSLGDRPLLCVLGFVGRAFGLRDDQLALATTPQTLDKVIPGSLKKWPARVLEMSGDLTLLNDHVPPGPEKEGKLKELLARADIDLVFVANEKEYAEARSRAPC